MNDRGFHLLPFYTAALASGASNVALGAVTDPVFPIQNSLYTMPKDLRLMVGYVGIPDLTAIRLNMPSLLQPFIPYLDPVSLTALPANMPPLVRFGDQGWPLESSEQISLEASRAVVAAVPAYAGLWMSASPPSKASGQIRTLFATAACVAAAGTWAQGNLTLVSQLQAGTYAVVGLSVYGTNALFSRLIFPNQAFRPGTLAQGAVGEWNDETFRRGNLGVWGTFENWNLPQIEVFGTGATATQTVLIDVIKTS